jgi:glutamate-5-semialdehyde dehydrogenase
MNTPTAAPAITTDTVNANVSGLEQQLKQAKQAFYQMAKLTTCQKNDALTIMAQLIEANKDKWLAANQQDLTENTTGLDAALQQRLKLDAGKIQQLVQGVEQVVSLADPCGKLLEKTLLDDGLILEKKSVPLGLIGIIFEARPDVMPQILSLILKSGNAVVFKGGAETKHTNQAFMNYVVKPLSQACPYLPEGWATLLESRAEVQAMLAYHQYVDLVIPRGSNQLVQHIMSNTRIPVLGHADGVCHQFVHHTANIPQAIDIAIDSKIQYPAACNALETLLVEQRISPAFLTAFAPQAQAAGITLKACENALPYLPNALPATPEDWVTEYGDTTLAVKVVESLEAAVSHINTYGSHHTDGIICNDDFAQALFLSMVDSASVFANCSTRFADGFRYGLGAEIGISTARTHARGPVGLEGLVSYKYQLIGSGQVVKDYVGTHPKSHFKHQSIITH